jgi:hypothetical protein
MAIDQAYIAEENGDVPIGCVIVYEDRVIARAFAATLKTVQKWLQRYRQERPAGLEELPSIPAAPTRSTPPSNEKSFRCENSSPSWVPAA